MWYYGEKATPAWLSSVRTLLQPFDHQGMRARTARALSPPPPSFFLRSQSMPKIKRNLEKGATTGRGKAKEANRMANKRRNASFILDLDAVLAESTLDLGEGKRLGFGQQRGGENCGDVPGDTTKQVINPLAYGLSFLGGLRSRPVRGSW